MIWCLFHVVSGHLLAPECFPSYSLPCSAPPAWLNVRSEPIFLYHFSIFCIWLLLHKNYVDSFFFFFNSPAGLVHYSYSTAVGGGSGTSFSSDGQGRITAVRVWEITGNYITGSVSPPL